MSTNAGPQNCLESNIGLISPPQYAPRMRDPPPYDSKWARAGFGRTPLSRRRPPHPQTDSLRHVYKANGPVRPVRPPKKHYQLQEELPEQELANRSRPSVKPPQELAHLQDITDWRRPHLHHALRSDMLPATPALGWFRVGGPTVVS